MKLLKNKHGFSCIEAIPAILALIIALVGFLDISLILKKINVISTTSTYIARTIGPQGGVLSGPPRNNNNEIYYPGCKAGANAPTCKYTNIAELRSNVSDMLSAVGLSEDDYTVTITAIDKNGNTVRNYNLMKGNAKGIETDFGGYFKVNLQMKYKWVYVEKLFGRTLEYKKPSVRNVLSTFKTRK